jgi:polysaccharide export outer membrane protein
MKKNSGTSFVCIAFVLAAAQAICASQAEPQSSAGAAAAPVSSASAPAVSTPSSDPASASPASGPIPAASAPTSGSLPQFQSRDPRYRIAASDSFDLTFALSPEYNQVAVTVQPDGFVTLYGIGDVKVQGQTMPELTETVRTAYSKILHEPIVSIALKDFNKPYFIADGQVGHPGKYDLRQETTLSQAIAIAGGFTEDAKHSQVILVHRVSDQYVSAQIFDVKKMEAKGDLREDPYLHPGDQILVPKSRSSKIKGWMPSTGVGAYVPIK